MKKMFIFRFLSFPTEERISGQNTPKKSCLEYDFASNCSGQMSFRRKVGLVKSNGHILAICQKHPSDLWCFRMNSFSGG